MELFSEFGVEPPRLPFNVTEEFSKYNSEKFPNQSLQKSIQSKDINQQLRNQMSQNAHNSLVQTYANVQIKDIKVQINRVQGNTPLLKGSEIMRRVYGNIIQTNLAQLARSVKSYSGQTISTLGELFGYYDGVLAQQLETGLFRLDPSPNSQNYQYSKFVFVKCVVSNPLLVGVLDSQSLEGKQYKGLIDVEQAMAPDTRYNRAFFYLVAQDQAFNRQSFIVQLLLSCQILLEDTSLKRCVNIYLQKQIVILLAELVQQINIQQYNHCAGLVERLLRLTTSKYAIEGQQKQVYDQLLRSLQFNLQVDVDRKSDQILELKSDTLVDGWEELQCHGNEPIMNLAVLVTQIDLAAIERSYAALSHNDPTKQAVMAYMQRNNDRTQLLKSLNNFFDQQEFSTGKLFLLYRIFIKYSNVVTNLYTPEIRTIMQKQLAVRDIYSQLQERYQSYPTLSSLLLCIIVRKAPFLIGLVDESQLNTASIAAATNAFDSNSNGIEGVPQLVTYFYGYFAIDDKMDFVNLVLQVQQSFQHEIQDELGKNSEQITVLQRLYLYFLYGIHKLIEHSSDSTYAVKQRLQQLGPIRDEWLEVITDEGVKKDQRMAQLE